MITPLHITRGTAVLKEERTCTNFPLRILAEDGYKYITKTPKGASKIDIGIVSEFLATILLTQWNIFTPQSSGLYINPQLIGKNSDTHARHKKSIRNSEICFGSRLVSRAIDFNPLLDDGHYWTYKALDNPVDLLKIGLFDLWCMNIGRNKINSNLILKTTDKGKLKIIPIGHTKILNGQEYKQLSADLFLHPRDTLLDLKLCKKIHHHTKHPTFVSDMSKYYLKSISATEKIFSKMDELLPKAIKFDKINQMEALSFLTHKERNKQVFQDFINALRS